MSVDLTALIRDIHLEMETFHNARGGDAVHQRDSSVTEYMYLLGMDRETFSDLVGHFTSQQMARTLSLMLEITAAAPVSDENVMAASEALATKMQNNAEAVIKTAIIVAYRIGRDSGNDPTENG